MIESVTNLSAHQELFLNSWHFAFFAVIAVSLLRILCRFRVVRNWFLLLASVYFLFYFVGDLFSAVFLLGLIFLAYCAGEVQARCEKRLSAWFPVLLTIGGWCFLFMVKNPALLKTINVFHIIPVRIIGISYIVFRCLHYVLDAAMFERRSFLAFCNYIIFFPTLIAGPIERFQRFEAFHDGREKLDDESVLPALHRIANGFIKKFVIADNLAVICIYSRDGTPWSPTMLWIGVLLQPALLYFGFSGYCDIMIGISRLIGFNLCENFRKPWEARNIQEFWERWHISLSSFVRDYCFNPINIAIGRNIKREFQFVFIVAAYFFTMLLIALWHATTWGFLIFGVLHGTALVASLCLKKYVYPRLNKDRRSFIVDSWSCNMFRRIVTYVFVSMTMLFWYFGPSQAFSIIVSMFRGGV